ncbi:MAG: TRAP transporter substrate-binding protein DctP [Lachnospiraceae bacterium]|nr:TRAP transporter substrate-binding protein DctP [Lachnospiraceae bacterium]
MKKITRRDFLKGSAAGVVSAMAVSAVGPLTASAADVTFTMAEVNPADTIVGQMDQAFADKVAELSDGSMQINIMFSGVLGAEEDVLDTMLGGGGTIDISRISAFALTSYGGEKSMLLSLPYTFESREHFWAFATSDLAQEFLLEPVENGTGIRGLFYGEEGFRHFFTVDEVSGIEDLAGMKIRVSNDAIMNGLVESLGASPTVVSFTELYSALQTGVVDAAEQPIANYQSNAFPEVAPNLILDGHTLGAVQVVMTDDAWNSLTEEQQAIITEAGEYASNYCREISQSAEDEVLAELIEEGVNVVEVDDLTPWQEAVADLVAENIEGQEDLYQQLLDFADEAE